MQCMTTHLAWTVGVLLLAAVGFHRSPLLAKTVHQPQPSAIRVSIDVKPGDTPTTLEPKREGMVPIAILSTKDFDAAQVDPATVRAGATGSEASIFKSMMEDVDRDKDVDLLLLFRVPQLALTCSTKSVIVTGKTQKGQDFEGAETVTMVGC
jgi:hypothetical protein